MKDITGGIALLIVYEVLWADFLEHAIGAAREMGLPAPCFWKDTTNDRRTYFDMMTDLRLNDPLAAQTVVQGLFSKYGVELDVRVGRRPC